MKTISSKKLDRIIADKEQFIKMYNSNMATSDIAKYYDVSYTYLHQHIFDRLRARGIITKEMDAHRQSRAGAIEKNQRAATIKRIQYATYSKSVLRQVYTSKYYNELVFRSLIALSNPTDTDNWIEVQIILCKIHNEYFKDFTLSKVHRYISKYIFHKDKVKNDLFLLMNIVDFDENISEYLDNYTLSEQQQIALKNCLAELTEREQYVVNLAFRNEEYLTNVAMSELLNVGHERIRQLKQRTLHRLRHPARMKRIIYGEQKYLDCLQQESAELKQKQSNILNDLRQQYKRDGQLKIELLQDVLSTRAFNCLKHLGIDTIDEIQSTEQIMKAYSTGPKTCIEIQNMLRTFDIALK